MKEIVSALSAYYWPTDKPPSDSLSCTSSYACTAHSLQSEFCHTISFSVVLGSPLCPNLALLEENAVLYALGKNFED
jgi:hypothetical protein